VVSETKQTLEQINEVSRQLLSRILSMQENVPQDTIITNETANDEAEIDGSTVDNELTELMSKRDMLIRSLFTEKKADEIEQELDLLNEMVSLDSKLASQSQSCKKILAEQVIKIKKGKKVSKSYQKY